MTHIQDDARLVYSTNGSHKVHTKPTRQSPDTLLGDRLRVLSVNSARLFHWLWNHFQQSGKIANYLDDARIASFAQVSIDAVPDARFELVHMGLVNTSVTERVRDGIVVRGASYSITHQAREETAARIALRASKN